MSWSKTTFQQDDSAPRGAASGRARHRWLHGLLALVMALTSLVALPPTPARAAVITVPIGGSLQSAVNNAQPGDVIRLAGNTQANESVNLALMGSAVGSGPGDLTIVGVNGASATLLGGNGTRLSYTSATPFPGTLTLSSVTFSTSASTTTPAVNLQNMRDVFVINSLFDGIGAEGCASGVSGCTGLYLSSASSGTSVFGIYSSTFRNIAADAVSISANGTATVYVTVNTTLITDNGINAAVTNGGVVVNATGSAVVYESIAQTSFSQLTGPAVYTTADDTSIVSTNVVSNVLTTMQGTSLGAIVMDTTADATANPTLNATIADNQISNIKSQGILSQYQSGNGSLNLNLQRNQIDTVDTTSNKRGITVSAVPDAKGTLTVMANNNTVSNTGGSGIRVDATDTNTRVHLRNNNLTNNNQGAFGTDAGIYLRAGFGSTAGLATTFIGSVQGNQIPVAGVKLGQYTTASMSFETNGPASTTYIQNNNTFNGGGTLSVVSGSIGDVALNSVPTLVENLAPGAFSDFFTVPTNVATLLNVMLDDRDTSVGDAKHLLAFQEVSTRGSAITRNDNGTPADLTDDQLTVTSLPATTGLDVFYYIIRDNGGRTSINQVLLNVVADSTPPDTTITVFPPNPSNDNTPTFQFTGTDNLTAPASLTFQCRVYLSASTPPAFSACTSPFTSAALPDGTYIFQVRAIDQVGNIDPTPASYTWTIDATAPTAVISGGPTNPTNNTSANFTFSATDSSGINRYECSLDGATFATCTSPQPYSGLAEGNHTFQVRAVDNAGNTQASATSYTWVIDLTAPNTTITGNPTALSNSSAATFSFTGSDPTSGGVSSGVASFQCKLDTGAFAACTSPRTLTGLADGPHTFEVYAIDAAGNADSTPANYTWTVDTTAPPAPVVLTPANSSVTNQPQPPVTGTAEPGSTVNIFIDGSVVGNTTADGSGNWSFNPTIPLANGAHTVKARSADPAGNVSVDSNTNTFTVDTVEPNTTFTVTPPAASNSTSASFEFSATDSTGISRYECSLDGAAFATCTSPFPLSGLTEGSHTFRARAVDLAGNTETTPASYTWIVDLTAPDTTITGNPTALSNSTSATFSFVGNDPTSGGVASGVASFECALDGGTFAACTSPRTLTGLSDGSHTFAVRAIDNAGNVDGTPATYTWTVDTTPPPAPVVITPANGSVTNDNTPTVTGTAEPGSTVTVLIDGSSVGNTTADGSGNWTFTPASALADGSHTVRVRATDAANNTSVDSNTNTFMVDTAEPDTSFTATPPAATNSTSANFVFTGNGTGSAISRYECSLDGAAFATCTSPQNPTGLAEGSHTYRVRAVDVAGNTETTPASYTWTVDLTAPDTSFTSTPTNPSNSASATFQFSGSDPTSSGVSSGVASFECALDGGAFAACTSPRTLTGLSDGSHTFEVRAVDNAGNVDGTPASYTWTVDTLPPGAPIVTAPANGSVTNDNTPLVTGTAEANSTVTIFIDGSAVGNTTADGSGAWSFPISSALADGAHTVKARASDAAGNTGVDSATNTFTVDTIEPDTTFTTTPPAATNSTSANFVFTGNGTGSAISRYECSLDGAAFATCTSPQNPTGLSEGSHIFLVRAVDAAGNTDSTPASYTWVVDLTAPDTSFTGTPPNPSNSGSATFQFTGSDPTSGGVSSGVASFQCSLDGAAFTTCTSPQSPTGLSDGSHTFAVRAVDAAGNADGSPASYTWLVDTTGPDTTIDSGPFDPDNSADATFTFSGTDPSGSGVASFECRVDGGTFAACTSPHTVSGLAQGSHTFEVRAVDAAGNVDPTPASYTWVVDTLPPDTTLTSTPPTVTNSTSASFTYSGDDGSGSGINVFECSLDGAAFNECPTAGTDLTGLAEGVHTFEVRAKDNADNTDPTPASYTWTVDLTAPDTSVVSGPPAASASASATFDFSGSDNFTPLASLTYECSLDGGAFAACTDPVTFTGLADGPHTLAVRAVDLAGNRDASPASYAWTVDTVAPAAPVVLTPADGALVSTAQPPVSGTAEPGSTVTVLIDGTSVGAITADGSGNWTLTPPSPLGEGPHTVRARATDAAGNTSPDSNTNTFTVDTLAPDTTITTPPPAATNSTGASIAFTGSDSGSGVASFECSLDSAPFAACASPASLSGLAEGSHTFQVRAVDNAGNTDASPASVTWVVDLTAPDTTITAQPPLITNNPSATFVFSGSDPVSGGVSSGAASFECNLDGAGFVKCASPQSYTGLADGQHTFAVRAVDAAGNTDGSPATYTWTVDTSALTVTIDQASGQADPTGVSPIVFTVVFNKPVTGFDAADIDLGASTAPGTLSANVSGSGATYTVSVSGMTGPGVVQASVKAGAATDAAGNTSLVSTSTDNSVTFNPNTPTVTGIVRIDPNPTNAASVRWRVTFSEAVTGVDAADFALAITGLTGSSIGGVIGSGGTYTVTVSTGSGGGSLGLNLVDDDSIRGALSQVALGGAGAANGNFTGEVYAVDRIPPSGTLAPPAPVVRNTPLYTFTVVFTDDLAVKLSTIDSADIRVTGPNGYNQLATLVSVTPSADGSPLQAMYTIPAPGGKWQNKDNGVYTIALEAGQISDTAGILNLAKELGRITVNLTGHVYLPMVANRTPLPDLVVDQINFTSNGVEVVLRNQGGGPVDDPFWVDLYIAPDRAPTAVNQTWQSQGSQGMVWGVTRDALPIAPGQGLKLRLGDAYFRPDQSSFPATIAAGTPIYVQADSANALTTYGGVFETHERDGGVYNNIRQTAVPAGGVAPATASSVKAPRAGDLPARVRSAR